MKHLTLVFLILTAMSVNAGTNPHRKICVDKGCYWMGSYCDCGPKQETPEDPEGKSFTPDELFVSCGDTIYFLDDSVAVSSDSLPPSTRGKSYRCWNGQLYENGKPTSESQFCTGTTEHWMVCHGNRLEVESWPNSSRCGYTGPAYHEN
jgi:hypothetical protein